ncbi:MAG: ArgR family transcriptional regulator [Bacteroidales bacterium]|nr:ArgR family transcriptional regulator [Bacteroidales bacterium]
MGNRTERLLAIKELITTKKISSQEELLNLLEERNLNYTQATLSRDLKFLKVNKISDPEKGYIYELPDQHAVINETAGNFAARGFISIQFANHLGIIKTMPGYASSIASLVDEADPFEIVGTIAGDDTILIIPHDNVSESDIINALVLIIPELKEKLS